MNSVPDIRTIREPTIACFNATISGAKAVMTAVRGVASTRDAAVATGAPMASIARRIASGLRVMASGSFRNDRENHVTGPPGIDEDAVFRHATRKPLAFRRPGVRVDVEMRKIA